MAAIVVGTLDRLGDSSIYRSFKPFYFRLTPLTLTASKSEDAATLEEISVSDVTSVRINEGKKGFCFDVQTMDKQLTLRAPSEDERTMWISALERLLYGQSVPMESPRRDKVAAGAAAAQPSQGNKPSMFSGLMGGGSGNAQEAEIQSLKEKLRKETAQRIDLEETLEEMKNELTTVQQASATRIKELEEKVDELEEIVECSKHKEWVRNEDRTECAGCSKAFSMILRKHHCRKCGEIYCSGCTANRIPLLKGSADKARVRVCDACAEET